METHFIIYLVVMSVLTISILTDLFSTHLHRRFKEGKHTYNIGIRGLISILLAILFNMAYGGFLIGMFVTSIE